MPYLSLASFWDVCISFLYSQEYAKELSKLLSRHDSKKILDAACGTGFPSLQLLGNGFDVVFSDGNNEMLELAELNAAAQKKKIDFHNLKWQQLNKNFNEEFDAVLCRGNSLPYVTSWGKNSLNPKKSFKELQTSLKNFHNVLKPNGILYVDLPQRKLFNSFNGIDYRLFERKKINGREFSGFWIKKLDRQNKISFWITQLLEWKVNSVIGKTNFSMPAYLLEHNELEQLLLKAGFSNVKEVKIKGENNYDVFIARK